SVSLYQAANAALACTRLVHPIVKKGGIIILKQVGGQVAIRGTGTGPFSLASHLMGTQRFLEELAMASVEPEGEAAKALRHLLELTSDALIDFAKAEVDAGADIVQAGDSLASIDGISPRMYQEWAWPYEKKFFDALNKYAQERKVMTLLHVCGNMTPVLSLMADTGAMILELDYKVDKVDLAVNKAAVGDRVCLMGNLNPAELLLRGTAADVTAESQRCIDAAGKGSGFILGSGCELAYYIPQENVKAMIRVARQNHYPL
ncbi:MAG: uroporphyrinogen decarboxylase, partial [Moorella sp. (in: firmicutes)]|nr:uroporphyrinogen decarboxylase [Moorella sp. (in: firmicutes)]